MVDVGCTMTFEDEPIDVLYDLISKRQALLGESYKQAVTATTIQVLKSIRADTKIAKKQAPKSSYTITDTGWFGGWERKGKKFVRVPRQANSPKSSKVPNIHPVNLAGQKYIKGEIVKVYKIEPVNQERMRWERSLHKGCWYVFAKSEKVADRFAKTHMTRRIQMFRGLAKTALGYAMAGVSDAENITADVTSTKSLKSAQEAAKVITNNGNNTYSVTVIDAISYATLALRSGENGIDRAEKKAANSIAARLGKVMEARLDEPIATPFPEVKGR